MWVRMSRGARISLWRSHDEDKVEKDRGQNFNWSVNFFLGSSFNSEVWTFPFTGNTDIYYGYVGVVRDSTFNFLQSKESTLLLHGCMCGFQLILPNLVLRISTFTFSIKLLISPLNFFFPFIYLIVRLAFGLLEVLGPTVKQSHLSSVSI